MRISVQRVSEASVAVLNDLGTLDPTYDLQQIGPGLLLTVETAPTDNDATISTMANRVLTLRCFNNPQHPIPRSIQEIQGEILSIPQPLISMHRPTTGRPYPIAKDTDSEHANLTWIRFNEALRSGNIPVYEGRYGARMRIGSVADGPFQFTLTSDEPKNHHHAA